MALAKLKRGTPWTPDIVRQRIKTSLITKKLMDHVFGLVEMTSTQIAAAQTLLRKTLPDLSAVEHSGSIDTRTEKELTDAELGHIAARSSTRAARSPRRQKEPSEVH